MIFDVGAFFLGGVLLWVEPSSIELRRGRHAASSMAVEKYFLLTCMRISLFPSVFYDLWCSCVSFLGGVLLWGGVKFYWAPSRSTRGSSIGVEKYFPLTCMRISLFSSVFYDLWCSCVSFLGGVLLCGGVKFYCVEVDMRGFLHGTRETFPPYLHEDQFVFKCVLWSLVFVRFYLGGVLLCRGVKVYWAAWNLDLSFSLGVNHLHEVREYFLYANSKHWSHMHLGVSM